MDRFNPHMLALARDARGLTQPELAPLIPIAQGTLSKYETGVKEPPDEFADAAGRALGFPPSFFYQPDRPYGFPPFHYRKRKKLSAKALGRIVAEMNIRRMHIRKMLPSFPLPTNRFIPEIDRDEYGASRKGRLDIEDVARAVREHWMVPSGPIENLMTLLEENGGIVIPCDFGTDLLDAMSQRIDGMPVLFFVNTHSPSDRLRYTLAHELGHMVLHTIALQDDAAMEEEADEFAGAFLMPADEVRHHLRKFDLRQLANMKGYWKVSMAAIAVRADRLKLITPYQSRMFWTEMSRLGYRTREPNEPVHERPTFLDKMVRHFVRTFGYTRDDMAKLLDLLPGEFDRMYVPEAFGFAEVKSSPHLRVVK
jgi:Zn-dependent peptidase ImmA (M78 family)/transcriptional regulator with XRE-family HTH domain